MTNFMGTLGYVRNHSKGVLVLSMLTVTIVETELKSISVIVVAKIATIARELFPYDRNRFVAGNYMETSLCVPDGNFEKNP